MKDGISPCLQAKYGCNWDTPARAKVRTLHGLGIRRREIYRMTGIPEPTITRIVNEDTARRTRKGRRYKPNKITNREVRRIIRYLSKSYNTRQLSYPRLRSECAIKASESTISRALKRLGYRRYVACPRPFITPQQARRRLAFAQRYRW